jgi:transposase
LEALLARNSSNSSTPPSANPPSAPAAPARKPSGRRRGGQPGHKGHSRLRLPPEALSHVVPLVPDKCQGCGHALPARARPGDPEPSWHQVVELPRLACVATEFQGHARTCPCCKAVTRHPVPAEIKADCFGPRLAAALNLLAGCQHVGARGLEEVARVLLGVPVSLGTLLRLQSQMALALQAPAQALAREVADAPAKHVDETGWKNAGQRRWLWVAATARASCFLVHRRRGREALHALLGGEPSGTVVSDRWSAYSGVPAQRRQLCWAHLKRDFKAMEEAGGKAGRAGLNLGLLTEELFWLLRKVRDGTRTLAWLRERVEQTIRPQVRMWLESGASSGHAPTKGTCAHVLGLEESMWTFARVEGVEPTNNEAERALRPAVVRRKKSFGSASAGGETWLARILGVTQTLKKRGLAVLEYLAEALRAFRSGLAVSPVPQSS